MGPDVRGQPDAGLAADSPLLPNWDHGTLWYVDFQMRVIARNTLRAFWQKHADAEGPLRAWFAETSHGAWHSMADIKQTYATASIIDSERVVFNVGGNKYRLVVKIWFPGKTVWIKFVGTHGSYDLVDVKKL